MVGMKKSTDIKKQKSYLKKADPCLKRVIETITLPPIQANENYFQFLIEAIINQQLSNKAAATLIKRFNDLFPGKRFPTPQTILKMPDSTIRAAGISTMKISFIKDLAKRILDHSIDLKTIDELSDEDVVAHLIQVRGIGPWTAEMFLMFSLLREDVFSQGDLGLKNGIKKIYNLKKHPSPQKARQIAEKWRPYRTLAARYIWASIDTEEWR